MAERERWGALMEAFFAREAGYTLGVMIVDARHKPTANDITMAQFFLQTERPFVVVANKCDNPTLETHTVDFLKLGFQKQKDIIV